MDHRSLKARRQEALAKGNTFLAELLDRVPERAVGPLALLERGNRNVLAQKKLRALNQSKEKNIVAKTFLMDGMRRDKLMKRIHELEANTKQLDGMLNQDEKAALAGTLQKIQSQQDALQAAFDASIWAAAATESSMLAFMTEDEREAWQTFKAAGQELKHWQDFYSSIQEDAFPYPAQLQELRAAINRETSKIRQAIRQQAPTIRAIFSRLNEAHTKRDIMRHAGNLLFDARLTKAKIDGLIQQQEKELANLQDRHKRLTDSLRQSPSYTAGAVADYMDLSLKELYAKEHKVRAEMRQLAKHVISPARAKAMAENVYTKGEFKKLRADEREFAKKTAAGKLSPDGSTGEDSGDLRGHPAQECTAGYGLSKSPARASGHRCCHHRSKSAGRCSTPSILSGSKSDTLPGNGGDASYGIHGTAAYDCRRHGGQYRLCGSGCQEQKGLPG